MAPETCRAPSLGPRKEDTRAAGSAAAPPLTPGLLGRGLPGPVAGVAPSRPPAEGRGEKLQGCCESRYGSSVGMASTGGGEAGAAAAAAAGGQTGGQVVG